MGEENPKQPVGSPGTQPPPGMMEFWIRFPRRKLWMTITITAVTAVIYLLQVLSNALFKIDIPLNLFALAPELVREGQLWRIVTPVLVHGSILHVLLNLLAFFTLGRSLERFYGPWRLLIVYLIGAVGGSLFHFYFSTQVAIGAATGIFALAAAQLVIFLRNRFLWGQENRYFLRNFGGILAINLVINLFPGLGGISMIGGFLAGLAFAWFAGPHYNLILSDQDPKLFDLADRVDSGDVLKVTALILLVIALLFALRFLTA